MSTDLLFQDGELLPPHIEQVFRPLCEPIQVDALAILEQEVRRHRDTVRAALRHNEFIDVEAAEALAERLLCLLARYEDHSTPERALIVGAARYFAQAQDADPDTGSILGLDDDVVVLNHVLSAIGYPEWKIERYG